MFEFIIGVFLIYCTLVLLTSYLQITYVQNKINKKEVILSKKQYKKAGKYTIDTQKFSIVSNIFDFGVIFIWLVWGLSFLQNELLFVKSYNSTLFDVVFVLAFLLVGTLLSLPFSAYSTFVLDKKYKFSKSTPSLFVQDNIKSTLLLIIIGAPIIALLSYIYNSFDNWWVIAFIAIFIILILVNLLAPYFMTLFNKFEPLKDKKLSKKIKKLLKSVGFKSSGVFSMDASKRDNRLNAFFGGLGNTKRVVLYDTLIKKLTTKEILAVLAHELGHFKNKDIIKNIAIMGCVLFVFLAFFGNLPLSLYQGFNLEQNASSFMVLFLIFSGAFGFFLTPLISFISRHNEYGADKFAGKLTSKKDLVDALLKLVTQNKSFPFSHPLYVFFYYSHPTLLLRFKELGYDIYTQKFKKDKSKDKEKKKTKSKKTK